jgi:hypothetical protein
MVEGTFSIHDCHFTALINPGSTHSFVNKTRTWYLNWVGKELPYIMHVSTPMGKTAVANKYIPDYDIQVGKEALRRDLIVMAIKDYDLILGID